MAEIIQSDRRAAARRAMEGEEWRKKREAEEQTLERRRAAARTAMESQEQRQRRTAAATAVAAATEEKAAADRARQAAIAAARAAVADARETETRIAAARAAAETTRRQTARTATNQIEKLKTEPSRLEAIRTLKTDLAAAASSGATLTQTIIRNQKNGLGAISQSKNQNRRPLLLTVTVILFILGAGGGIYLYFYGRPAAPAQPPGTTPVNPLSQKFVPVDKEINLNLSGKEREEIIIEHRRAFGEEPLERGRIIRFKPTVDEKTAELKTWLEKLPLALPETLRPLLGPDFLLGRYNLEGGAAAFLFLETADYVKSFAAIRESEKELVSFFYLLTGRPTPGPVNFQNQLQDNLETRNLIRDGKTVLLYAFLDPTTIVIAEDETALSEISRRRTLNR